MLSRVGLYGSIVKPSFDSLIPSRRITTSYGAVPLPTMPDGRNGLDVAGSPVPAAFWAATDTTYIWWQSSTRPGIVADSAGEPTVSDTGPTWGPGSRSL